MNQRIRIHKGTPNTGAMDFSWLLDAPAGKHGFVEARDGSFAFRDGTPARFVGFNFPARANMPDHETADRVSARLATMGANVVRIHAEDAAIGPSGWSSNADCPLIDYESGNSRNFNEAGLERFDYWTARLIEKGIYLHLDLLVGRAFLEGDELDYPDGLRAVKSNSHLNSRLLELQKEFATKYLTHVNRYTGRALIDEPAVMGIQITNEDSIFFDAAGRRYSPGAANYHAEMKRRFNRFLLAKYDTREKLARAWTCDGKCALRDDEDPEQGTVACAEIGDYHQMMNEPMGDWMAQDGPARYADFAEFGIWINRRFYGEMLDHVRSLGAKVPLVTSCLLTGAADIYSHADGDFMENNTYFNHPAPRFDKKKFLEMRKLMQDGKRPSFPIFVPNMREYVTCDPRTATAPGFDPRSNLTTQASGAVLRGKPFVLSEWNEYGENPFHASAFSMTAAYGCLNGWSGLIVYCYHTDDNLTIQADDEIADIMDAYNDPSLVLQFGVMAAILIRGLVREAEHEVDVVFTKNDCMTQPSSHRMPFTYFPFVSKVRNVYLDTGTAYHGDADVAVSGGFVSGVQIGDAKHAILYAHSPYRDAFRREYAGEQAMEKYRAGATHEIPGVARFSDRYLTFDDIDAATAGGDYSAFSDAADKALKSWGLLGPDRGCVDGAMVSDTGELVFDPGRARFAIRSEACPLFTGKPEGGIRLGRRFTATCKAERMTLSMLPLDGEEAYLSRHLLFTAIGKTGMDETQYEMDEDGFTTKVTLKGKLFIETMEGTLRIADGRSARVYALDPYGNRIGEIPGREDGDSRVFTFDGSVPSGNYEVIL